MKRLLLVVDEAVADIEALPADVCERLVQFDEIRVVAPALNSRLNSWANDTDGAVADAETRLRQAAADAGAEHVLSVHLSARASGTVESARAAAADAPAPVTVVDSGTTSFGVGICVLGAAQAIAAGATAGEAAA